ncbi:hypothetical protein [Companilactobacillus halodurans]|uniref:YolD-like family protein n=1 Tax=Companilactobacillus halodurans TaxID=2584183 RepID=A0A5P0ZUF1_9LACO|nr:hypothetical protein [Companilactobacillus halodurans]MQS76109.1 hypothetical protein [Companilactobacillus halodurans]MQS96545.1 hypothetical protein [Companilactobacillus halodurans]
MDEKKLIEQKIFNDTSAYNDIMNLPYQPSKRHLPMPELDRAAQFAPFGALEGFKGLIEKKTQSYRRKKYTTADEEVLIKRQLEYLRKNDKTVDVNYFNEVSGYYEHLKGHLKSINYPKGIVMFEKTKVIIVNIRSMKLI